MIFNRKIEDKFGLRCHFKGGGGGLTGATTSTEEETQSQTTSQYGNAINLAGSSGGNNISITSSDPEVAMYAIQQANLTAQAVVGSTEDENIAAISTVNNIAGQLGQITANAAPQTSAAETEILSGYSPIANEETDTGTVFSAKNYYMVGIIAAIVGVGYLLLSGNKKGAAA